MKNLLGINAEGPLCHCFGCLGVWGHLDVFHLIHTGEQTTHIFVSTDHFYLGVLYQTKRTYKCKYKYRYVHVHVHLRKVCFFVLCLGTNSSVRIPLPFQVQIHCEKIFSKKRNGLIILSLVGIKYFDFVFKYPQILTCFLTRSLHTVEYI